MKTFVTIAIVVIAVAIVGFLAYGAGIAKGQREAMRLKAELAIYKNQAENYAQILRSIRETASQATIVEKAQ